MLNEHSTVFASNRSAICNRRFPGPTRVLNANGISIASQFLQGSLDRPTERPTNHVRYSVVHNRRHLPTYGSKGKERKSIYIAPFVYYVYAKALRHGSHSFTCQYTMSAFHFVSVHQMAPPLITKIGDIQLQLTTQLSTLNGWKAELAWLVDLYSGRFTYVSYRSRAGQGKFAGQRPTFYRCATKPTAM